MTAQATTEACAWCESPATGRAVVVPADINRRTGEVRRAAIDAPVCDEHARMVNLNVQIVNCEQRIRKLGQRIARASPHTGNHADLCRQLGQAELELGELRVQRGDR